MNGYDYYQNPKAVLSYVLETFQDNKEQEAAIINYLKKERRRGSNITYETLLDIGSGPGNASAIIIEKLRFKKLIAVDGSGPMLNLIPEFIDASKVKIETSRTDLRVVMPRIEASTVDLAIAIALYGYLEQSTIENIFQTVAHALKKNAYFGFSIPLHVNSSDESVPFIYGTTVTMQYYIHSEQWIKSLWKRNGFNYVGHEESLWNNPMGTKSRNKVIIVKKTE